MLTSSQANNGLACATNYKELDAVLLLVLWVQHLETFVAQRCNSDFLYITRVTDVLSRSSSAFSPYSFFTVLSAIMFTVDPLSSWNFSSFPLTSRVGVGWGCQLRLTN